MIINNNNISSLGQPISTSLPVRVEKDGNQPNQSIEAKETRYSGSSEKQLRMAELKLMISGNDYNLDFDGMAEKILNSNTL